MKKRILKNVCITITVAMAFMLIGCGAEEKTYSDGLSEGFKAGYSEGLFDYDAVAAQSGKIVVYADKYGYLTGYHDGIVGNNRLENGSLNTKQLHENYVEGYEQGFSDAVDGKDMLENYGGEHRWHSVETEKTDTSEQSYER